MRKLLSVSFVLGFVLGCGSKSPELGQHISRICLCDSTGICDPGCGVDGETDNSDPAHRYPYAWIYQPPSFGYDWSMDGAIYYSALHCAQYVACCTDSLVLSPAGDGSYIECAPSDVGHYCSQASACACAAGDFVDWWGSYGTTGAEWFCCHDPMDIGC